MAYWKANDEEAFEVMERATLHYHNMLFQENMFPNTSEALELVKEAFSRALGETPDIELELHSDMLQTVCVFYKLNNVTTNNLSKVINTGAAFRSRFKTAAQKEICATYELKGTPRAKRDQVARLLSDNNFHFVDASTVCFCYMLAHCLYSFYSFCCRPLGPVLLSTKLYWTTFLFTLCVGFRTTNPQERFF